ncbi:ribokinase [Staphylococcus auricularis]|uniref:Ribokinase n=1 Tax=Staphylococcus auricularis TaxID=29379 RepID=A0AAW7MCD4_9STAP|nr:ribokinase [Staphylococcus auricularis]MDC6327320.1 ribokinase [Staphylococcus auricularis]MDN4532966.1 ribokinase [Staphylococcus auricularis]
MKKKIVVVGSTGVDHVLNVTRFAEEGETLHVDNAQGIYGGGKGANQALATARAGANTTFVSKIGNDGLADFELTDFKEAGMDIQYISQAEDVATGQAFITVDEAGHNMIYVYGGANMELTPEDVEQATEAIKDADMIVAQLEILIETVTHAFEIARRYGVTTLLNPAPAKELPESLLKLTDIIVPNETEAALLSGASLEEKQFCDKTAAYFQDLGIKTVIVTLGEAGAYVATASLQQHVPGNKVTAVDTTAAGDTFIGAFVSRFDEVSMNLVEAITYANRASALTVQKAGAQVSIPTQQETDDATFE